MYAMTSAPRLAAIARSGVLNLHEYDVAEFSLDAASEAVAHAAMNSLVLGATLSGLVPLPLMAAAMTGVLPRSAWG